MVYMISVRTIQTRSQMQVGLIGISVSILTNNQKSFTDSLLEWVDCK